MTLRDTGNDAGVPESLLVGAIGVDDITFQRVNVAGFSTFNMLTGPMGTAKYQRWSSGTV
jgi:hypothetical protein